MEELVLRIIGYDMISKVLYGIGSSMDDMGKQGDGVFGRLRGGLNSISSAAAGVAGVFGGVFLGFVGGAALAIKSAAEFDSDVTLLVTHAGMAANQVDAMKQGLLALAPVVGFTADELAKAVYWIESEASGHISTASALQIQKAAAETAQMAHADLSDTTRTLAVIVGTMYPQALQNSTAATSAANDAAGVLNATVGHGVMTMDEMNAALRTGILPLAQNLGVTFPQVGAAIDVFTEAGYRGGQAGTALRNMMTFMTGSSSTAAKALQTLGLTNAQLLDTMRGPDGLVGALQLIHDHLQNVNKDAQVGLIDQIFGRTRGGASAIDLINHLGNIRDNLKFITSDAATFGEKWYTYTQTTVFQTNSVKDSLDALRIMVGEALEPAFQRVLAVIGPIIAQFAVWASAHPDLIAKVFTLGTAVSGLGAGVFGLIALVTRLGPMLLSGPGLALAAITFALYLVVTNMDAVKDAAQRLVEWWNANLSPVFDNLASSIQKTFGPALDTARGDLDRFAGWFSTTGVDNIQKFVRWLGTDFFPQLVDIFHRVSQVVLNDLVPAFERMADWVGAHVVPLLERFSNWFVHDVMPAMGAFISWTGSTVVPALTNLALSFAAIATWLGEHLIPLFATLVGSPIVWVIEQLGSHFWIVEAALTPIIAKLIIMQTMNLVGWFTGMIGSVVNFGRSLYDVGYGASAAEEGVKGLLGRMANFGVMGAVIGAQMGGIREAVVDGVAGIAAGFGGPWGMMIAGGIVGIDQLIQHWGEFSQQAMDNRAFEAAEQNLNNLSQTSNTDLQAMLTDADKAQAMVSKIGDAARQVGQTALADMAANFTSGANTSVVALQTILSSANEILGDKFAHIVAQSGIDMEKSFKTGQSSAEDTFNALKQGIDDWYSLTTGDQAKLKAAWQNYYTDLERQQLASDTDAFNRETNFKNYMIDHYTAIGQQRGLIGKQLDSFVNSNVQNEIEHFEKLHPEIANANKEFKDQAAYVGTDADKFAKLSPQVQQDVLDMQNDAGALKRVNDLASSLGINLPIAATGMSNLDKFMANIPPILPPSVQQLQNLVNTWNQTGKTGGPKPPPGVTSVDPSGDLSKLLGGAEGAKVTGPTMMWVGEGNDTEWVVPQHKVPPWMVPYLDAAVGSGAGGAPPPTGGGGSMAFASSMEVGGMNDAVTYLRQIANILSQQQANDVVVRHPATGTQSMLNAIIDQSQTRRRQGIKGGYTNS